MIASRLHTTALLLTLVAPLATAQTPDRATTLGISFPSDSKNTVLLTREGKRYLIDAAHKTVEEVDAGLSGQNGKPAALFAKNCAVCHGAAGRGNKSIGTPDFAGPAFQKSASSGTLQSAIQNGKGPVMPAWKDKLSPDDISSLVNYIRSLPEADGNVGGVGSSSTNTVPPSGQEKATKDIYQPGDDVLFTLPTARPTDRHGVYVNFAHRFPYQPAFTGTNEGATLFGLDNIAIPSFGFRYGVTENLSVSVFRAPSLINRPIQLMAGYNILKERKGDSLNIMVRVSIEGQDNFRKNYTENIEGVFSRSITSRAQIYLVPTFSFNDRRLEQPSGFASNDIANVPGVNAFSFGTGLAVDVRPTVALLAELIPTLYNARELDIHHPVYSFAIQKKIWRHSFTFGLTTSPGTTVSERAATRASFLNQPNSDTPGGLFVGFDLTRQIH